MRKLDANYLRDMKLQGVERINKVFLRQQDTLFTDDNAETGFRTDKEWVLDTEGVNLMGVSVHAVQPSTDGMCSSLPAAHDHVKRSLQTLAITRPSF